MLRHKEDTRGFHLIELIIVVVIISILAVLGLPVYTEYIVKERRLEAAALLSKLAIAAEQYHLENNSYNDMTLAALHSSEFVVKHHYQLMLRIHSADDYLLIAKPLYAQAQGDQRCGALILNAMGEKGVTGVGGVEACW